MNQGMQEWLSEKEELGIRWLRLIDEYENSQMNIKRIVEWLDAAYGRGYNDANKPDNIQ
jgi:hypothetical protein